MNTPVADFVRHYGEGDTARLHMPGHKGKAFLGCEPWDLTEIPGADALYQAQGILRESEANAAALFGSQRTCYSTEGSSQCLRAMLYLAVCGTGSRRVVAARNVHSAFVSAAALLDLEVTWLWPEESRSLCGCPVSPAQLEEALSLLPEPPAAVYLTSPDYLGAMAQLPSPWGRSAAAGECCSWWTTPTGPTCGFSPPPSTPWTWGPTCAATPPTRPFRCSPEGVPAHRQKRPAEAYGPGQGRPGPVRLHQPLLPHPGLPGPVQPLPGGGLPPAAGGDRGAAGILPGKATGRRLAAGAQRPPAG